MGWNIDLTHYSYDVCSPPDQNQRCVQRLVACYCSSAVLTKIRCMESTQLCTLQTQRVCFTLFEVTLILNVERSQKYDWKISSFLWNQVSFFKPSQACLVKSTQTLSNNFKCFLPSTSRIIIFAVVYDHSYFLFICPYADISSQTVTLGSKWLHTFSRCRAQCTVIILRREAYYFCFCLLTGILSQQRIRRWSNRVYISPTK